MTRQINEQESIEREYAKRSIKKTIEHLLIFSPTIAGAAFGFSHGANISSEDTKTILWLTNGLYTLGGGVLGAEEAYREGNSMLPKFLGGIAGGAVISTLLGVGGYIGGYCLGYLGRK